MWPQRWRCASLRRLAQNAAELQQHCHRAATRISTTLLQLLHVHVARSRLLPIRSPTRVTDAGQARRAFRRCTRISAGETAMDGTVVAIQRTRTPRALARSHPPTPDVCNRDRTRRAPHEDCGVERQRCPRSGQGHIGGAFMSRQLPLRDRTPVCGVERAGSVFLPRPPAATSAVRQERKRSADLRHLQHHRPPSRP